MTWEKTKTNAPKKAAVVKCIFSVKMASVTSANVAEAMIAGTFIKVVSIKIS
jgi:hypothetical protein